MGFDIKGRNPASSRGIEFTVNIWGWTPIAELIIKTAPEIASQCQHWFSNDGDGLDAENSRKLADTLKAELEAGRIPKEIADLVEDDFMPFLLRCGGFSIWRVHP
jgi:hypothetical protein